MNTNYLIAVPNPACNFKKIGPKLVYTLPVCIFISQHTLRDNTKITPSEVIVGGSLGQGTAVLGKFDIDLVIYTRGTVRGR